MIFSLSALQATLGNPTKNAYRASTRTAIAEKNRACLKEACLKSNHQRESFSLSSLFSHWARFLFHFTSTKINKYYNYLPRYNDKWLVTNLWHSMRINGQFVPHLCRLCSVWGKMNQSTCCLGDVWLTAVPSGTILRAGSFVFVGLFSLLVLCRAMGEINTNNDEKERSVSNKQQV